MLDNINTQKYEIRFYKYNNGETCFKNIHYTIIISSYIICYYTH